MYIQYIPCFYPQLMAGSSLLNLFSQQKLDQKVENQDDHHSGISNWGFP